MKGTIQIRYSTFDGEELRNVVVVARYGTLVVHRSMGSTQGKGEAKGWSISHEPSGLRVHPLPIKTKQRTLKLAKHLAARLDWSLVQAAGHSPEHAPVEFLQALRAELEAYGEF